MLMSTHIDGWTH